MRQGNMGLQSCNLIKCEMQKTIGHGRRRSRVSISRNGYDIQVTDSYEGTSIMNAPHVNNINKYCRPGKPMFTDNEIVARGAQLRRAVLRMFDPDAPKDLLAPPAPTTSYTPAKRSEAPSSGAAMFAPRPDLSTRPQPSVPKDLLAGPAPTPSSTRARPEAPPSGAAMPTPRPATITPVGLCSTISPSSSSSTTHATKTTSPPDRSIPAHLHAKTSTQHVATSEHVGPSALWTGAAMSAPPPMVSTRPTMPSNPIRDLWPDDMLGDQYVAMIHKICPDSLHGEKCRDLSRSKNACGMVHICPNIMKALNKKADVTICYKGGHHHIYPGYYRGVIHIAPSCISVHKGNRGCTKAATCQFGHDEFDARRVGVKRRIERDIQGQRTRDEEEYAQC
jgi:hypothetical protein